LRKEWYVRNAGKPSGFPITERKKARTFIVHSSVQVFSRKVRIQEKIVGTGRT
jgi:hypothetical protein